MRQYKNKKKTRRKMQTGNAPTPNAEEEESDYGSDPGASSDDEWNVDQFSDVERMPLHNMQKNLSYIKRKCKVQLEALNAMRGRENVNKEQYDEVVKAFIAAELELTERRAFDAAKCIRAVEGDADALPGRGIHEDIHTWSVEHFVARKKGPGLPYRRREFGIVIDEKSIKNYDSVNVQTNLEYNSEPHVWLQLLHSVYTSLLYDSTQRGNYTARADGKDVRQFIFLQENPGPSFMEAMERAAADAKQQLEARTRPAAIALFPAVSNADIGPRTEKEHVFNTGGKHALKYRVARLSNRNTHVDEKRRRGGSIDAVNEETSKFFNEKIAPHTECKWVELQLRLHDSVHFIRILRTPKKTNYAMIYPFFARSDDESDAHFREKAYDVTNVKPYAVKTPWIPGKVVVARISEVDTMVEAIQTIRVNPAGYKRLTDDAGIAQKIADGSPMKDDVRVYYSIQDEYFGQWTVWFVHYKAQILGVQVYYPSTAMLHANKADTRRALYNVNGTPHKHWKSTPRRYLKTVLDPSYWPSLTVEVKSSWHVLKPINGTYTPIRLDNVGSVWVNDSGNGVYLGTMEERDDETFHVVYNDGSNTENMTWAFYKQNVLAYVTADTPLNVTGRWANFSQMPGRDTVRIEITPKTLPVAVGKANEAKGPAPHTTPDAHLGAVMESLGDIRRALNHVAMLKLA